MSSRRFRPEVVAACLSVMHAVWATLGELVFRHLCIETFDSSPLIVDYLT